MPVLRSVVIVLAALIALAAAATVAARDDDGEPLSERQKSILLARGVLLVKEIS